MLLRIISRCSAAMLVISLTVSTAQAQIILGIGNGELLSINPLTGATTLIGTTTYPGGASGIDFRAGKLYVLPEGGNNLFEINPATGATIGGPIAITGSPPGLEGDLAFRADGVGFVSRGVGTGLWSFDLAQPVPTYTLISSTTPAIDGLAFNAAGVLYGLGESGAQLYTINTTTGVATPVGNGTGIIGSTLDVGGLAFDGTGNLFAISSRPTPVRLFSINTTTGVGTLIGNPNREVRGIRFGTGTPAVAGVTITQSAGSTALTEGGATDTYTVVLNTAPTANVTITLNPGTQVTATPTPLVFTTANWNVAQTVTVTAVDDALVEGAHTGTISHTATSTDTAYNGITITSVVASITDNDVGPPPPPPPPPPLTSGEGSYGGSGFFNFGGRMARYPAPMLEHFFSSQAAVRVRNVSGAGQGSEPAGAESGFGPLGWSLVLAVGAGLTIVLRRTFS